jgi:hypothetical protein
MFTLFTIDFENNPQRMNVFINFLRQCEKTSEGYFVAAIGCYRGKRENAFICKQSDFNRFIRGTVYMNGQESVLHVASGNKQEAHLEYLADGRRESLGSMHQVTMGEALASDGWTYRPDLDMYWVARPGNPDHSMGEIPHDWCKTDRQHTVLDALRGCKTVYEVH